MKAEKGTPTILTKELLSPSTKSFLQGAESGYKIPARVSLNRHLKLFVRIIEAKMNTPFFTRLSGFNLFSSSSYGSVNELKNSVKALFLSFKFVCFVCLFARGGHTLTLKLRELRGCFLIKKRVFRQICLFA